MGDKLREIIDDESMDHMGFEEKIKLMLDAETISRSDRKVERLIRQARFEYKDASIEGIQYPPERKLSRDRVDRLTACRWVRDRETLIIISGTGSDKSYISQALGNAAFRNGIVRIAATKVSAGVSTGIGDHESKYQGKEAEDAGDEQFEISDSRSLSQMYQDMAAEGLQPVLNDYLYV